MQYVIIHHMIGQIKLKHRK